MGWPVNSDCNSIVTTDNTTDITTGAGTSKINYDPFRDLLEQHIQEIAHQRARRLESDLLGTSIETNLVTAGLFTPQKYNLNRKVLIL